MSERTCSIDGCEHPVTARGLCKPCYMRARLKPGWELKRSPSPEEQFWSKVDRGGLDGHWLWTGYRGRNGYGAFTISRTQVLAHRFAYELLVGPIPDGLHIDHLCRTPLCVNPSHLEPVTPAENARRSPFTVTSINRAKTHCIQGHPFDDENTYRDSMGKRRCRTCHRDQERNRQERLRRGLR